MAEDRRMDLKDHIRSIPDFPKPGILFYDISTLLRDADAWQVAMGRMAKAVRAYQPDLLAGIESRGFLIAAPLALKLGCGFIMRCRRMRWRPVNGSSWWTTCWPPAAPWPPA